MPDFMETPSGKKRAEQFAVVRERGLLNSGLDILSVQVERSNPGMATRWERYSPSSAEGKDNVIMYEAMGWKLCSYADVGLPDATESTPREGIIRRGDLVLMMAPQELADAYRKQDEEAARVDVQAPKTTFEDALEQNQVRLGSGDLDRAKGIGTIKSRTEFVSPRTTEDS